MERKNTLELQLGGKVRTLSFGFEFLDALVNLIELPKLDEVARARPWKLLPIVATAALRAEAEAQGSTETFDEKTVGGWLHQHPDPDAIHEIRVCYEQNMAWMGGAISGHQLIKITSSELSSVEDSQG